MNQERLLKILLEPIISEKSTLAADKANQVVFKVAVDATKPEIKKAVDPVRRHRGEGPGGQLQGQAQDAPVGTGSAQKLEEGLRPLGGGPGHQLRGRRVSRSDTGLHVCQ